MALWDMVRVDSFSVFFHFLVAAIAVVVILTSYEYMAVQQIRAGEYYALILFGAVGMSLMSSAVELVLIFIALEISSISTYILAGFRRQVATSSESSLKYFLLGSFATAFFLYGVALMFGATGSTSIPVIADTLQSDQVPVLAYAGVALMFVGLAFKVAAAPFHIWTPDVYEGAPAPVVGFMSTAPKAAVFAVLLRIMFEAHAPGRLWLIWLTAALFDDDRQRGRTGAEQRQAPAGLFFHRTRRLFAGRFRGASGKWHSSRNVLYRLLRCDERGRICRSQPLCRRRRTLRQSRRLCWTGTTLSILRRHFHHISFVTDWDSGHWRFLREVLRLQRGAASEPGLAHDYWRPQQRHRRLLLPAHHRPNVHAGSAQ